MKLLKSTHILIELFLLVLVSTTAPAASTITYYHNDLLGSPVAATDASGHVIWRESYRPYGERLTNDPASTANDVWYTSRRQDADTGLVYMGARYYDPVAGRFVSKDPVGFDEGNIQSFNRYAYANDNPYRYVDPSGRSAGAVVAVTAGVLIVGGVYSQLNDDQKRSFLNGIGTLGKYTVFGQLAGIGNLILEQEAGEGSDNSGDSSPEITPGDLEGKTQGEIEDFARGKGLVQDPKKSKQVA